MSPFDIKFAPLIAPIQRFLQLLAVAAWVYTVIFGSITGVLLSIYLIIYTNLRWIVLPYLIWIYFIDWHTIETGGRINNWVKRWFWWKYFIDYFPVTLTKPETNLDPKKNYLFGCYPHGILAHGTLGVFASIYSGYKEYFPHHEIRAVTVSALLIFPFVREIVISLGGISATTKSINHVLSQPDGGHIVILMIGGAREAYFSKPGVNRIILKDRKGFVKLALRNGTSLVPVYSFGEIELYDQLEGPMLKKIQEILRKWTSIAPVVPIGRGFFQDSFGLLPRRHPVTTVVGNPIDVPKIENPTEEDVNKYHTIYTEKLTKLFEEHKHKYLKNSETKHLIIE